MKHLLNLLQRTATPRGLVVLIALYAIVFGAIALALTKLTTLTGGIGILDFDRGYSRERVLQVFDSYGADGWVLYQRIQLLDLLNPAIYSLFFASLTYLLWRHSRAVWLVVLPLLAGALDYAENLTLFLLSRSYPDISAWLVSVSSALSIIKNAALSAAVLALLFGSVQWARNRFWPAKP